MFTPSRLRYLRQQIVAGLFLPAVYFLYRFGADKERLGEFMCSAKIGEITGFVLFCVLAILALSMLIDLVFFIPRKGWFSGYSPQDYYKVMPLPRSAGGFLLSNVGGVVLLYTLSELGCWLLSK